MGKTALSTKAVERRHEARRVLRVLLLTTFALAVLAGSALAPGNLVKMAPFEKDSDGDGIPNKWVSAGRKPVQ
jgi:hypothetical protein